MDKTKKIVHSKAKCPKCKSNNLCLIELWKNHGISWIQKNGKFDIKDGALEPGDAYKVIGCCNNCYHRWTLKGCLQITDIIKTETKEHG